MITRKGVLLSNDKLCKNYLLCMRFRRTQSPYASFNGDRMSRHQASRTERTLVLRDTGQSIDTRMTPFNDKTPSSVSLDRATTEKTSLRVHRDRARIAKTCVDTRSPRLPMPPPQVSGVSTDPSAQGTHRSNKLKHPRLLRSQQALYGEGRCFRIDPTGVCGVIFSFAGVTTQ